MTVFTIGFSAPDDLITQGQRQTGLQVENVHLLDCLPTSSPHLLGSEPCHWDKELRLTGVCEFEAIYGRGLCIVLVRSIIWTSTCSPNYSISWFRRDVTKTILRSRIFPTSSPFSTLLRYLILADDL